MNKYRDRWNRSGHRVKQRVIDNMFHFEKKFGDILTEHSVPRHLGPGHTEGGIGVGVIAIDG